MKQLALFKNNSHTSTNPLPDTRVHVLPQRCAHLGIEARITGGEGQIVSVHEDSHGVFYSVRLFRNKHVRFVRREHFRVIRTTFPQKFWSKIGKK